MKETTRRKAGLSLAVAAIALGCDAPPAPPAEPVDGTTRMADTLAALVARAVADPTRNPFLNREWVALLRSMVGQQSGPMAIENRFSLAQELLLSGDPRAAIAELDSFARLSPAPLDPVTPTRLYHNNGDGTFADVTAGAGLEGKAIFAMGSNFGDLDNDGWLDFYVGTGNPDLRAVIPNRMFRSVQGSRFEEVSVEGGFAHLQKGHGTAFADLDGDGDEDVYMIMGGAYQGERFTSVLYEPPGWGDRAWISVELEGRQAPHSGH